MAEFSFVAKVCKEVCMSRGTCDGCPFDTGDYCRNCLKDMSDEEIAQYEKVAMDYYEKNAHRNPTWLELIKQFGCKITDIVPNEVAEKLGLDTIKVLAPNPIRCKNINGGICNIISVKCNEPTCCPGLCEHYVDSLDSTQDF